MKQYASIIHPAIEEHRDVIMVVGILPKNVPHMDIIKIII